MSDEVPEPDRSEPPAEDDVWARDTAPQTPYTTRQVWIGLVFLVILAVVAFGVPLAMT